MRITIEVTEEREYEIEHDDDYWICDSVLWKMRDEIDPPREGFVMYSSSGAEHNLEYLLENGWKPEDEARRPHGVYHWRSRHSMAIRR
jgi:hypothetical protein